MPLIWNINKCVEKHGEDRFYLRLRKEERPEAFEKLRPKTEEERTNPDGSVTFNPFQFWNFSNEDQTEICRRDGTTEWLIWTLSLLGVGEITKKNYKEVFTRIKMHEMVDGPPLKEGLGWGSQKEDTPCSITLEEVWYHIGMTVNALTITPRQFEKKMMGWMRREAKGEMRKQLRELEEKWKDTEKTQRAV